MAEFSNFMEEAQVNKMLTGVANFWIALTDLRVEGTFRWERSHEVPYDNMWAPGEPNNDNYIEDCVAKMYWGANGGRWFDMNCLNDEYNGLKFAALCQKSKSF